MALESSQASAPLPLPRLEAAALRARSAAAQRRPQQTQQATELRLRRRVHREGIFARGDGELPRDARMEFGYDAGSLHAAGTRRSVLDRPRAKGGRNLRSREA